MKQIIFILLFLIPGGFLLCLSSDRFCSKKKWKQTASGIYYKVYTNDTSKPKPVFGDHIWMHLRKYSPEKKEVFNTKIFDTANGVEMDYKKPEKPGDVIIVFSSLGSGDSAIVKVPANLLDSNGSKIKYYTFWLSLLNFKPKNVYQEELGQQYQKQSILDSLTIIDYIKNYEIKNCKQDENGNWFLRTVPGNGKPIKINETVTMHYIGKLVNGNQFDNSYDRKQTFSFTVGKKQVIDGLDKGIQQFFVGDKGVIIIPSRSGYGDKEVGKIPSNSVLIFEVEILE